ncbi:MAG: hypothetical protein JW717_08075 [Marinilabiliaceae bacterium]|nr:hypothetical protein [Marinilabiliaceae bacterium]
MKYIFLLTIVLSFCFRLNGQSTYETTQTLLNQYNSIQSVENDNERRYKLFTLSEKWLDLIKQTDFVYPDTGKYELKHTSSSDGKFSVYYFIPKIISNKVDVSIFISMKDTNGIKAFYFYEPIILSENQKKTFDFSNFKMEIFNKSINQINFYELQLKDSSNPIVRYKYTDIYLKFLFENMALSNNLDEKIEINRTIKNRLNILLKNHESFHNKFTGIKRMSTLISNDEKLKICTWNIETPDATHLFFGYIVINNNNNNLTPIELIDQTSKIRSPERSMLSDKKWYGAIYFDIIETQYKKEKTYTLLGFKGNDTFTKIKLADALTVLPNGKIRFGSNIFHKNPGYVNRIIFEYSFNVNMMLRYDNNLNMIVMDNLAPSNSMYKGIYRFYGPDFSYNGYKFEKGKWMLNLDLDLRNPKQE